MADKLGTTREYRSPGEKWSAADVELLGKMIERGVCLRLFAEGGPFAGERLLIPHIECARWVVVEADGGLASFVHPPGYLLDLSRNPGDPVGYYRFNRDTEMLEWTNVSQFEQGKTRQWGR